MVTNLQQVKNNNDKIQKLMDKITFKAPLLELIWDKSPILLFFKDVENNMVLVNNYFCEVAKIKKEDIEGHNLEDLMQDEEQVGKYFSNDIVVIKTGQEKIGIEEKFMDTDIIVRTDKFPIFNDTGEVIGILGLSVILNK